MTGALDSSSPAGSDRIRAWRKARREAGMVKLELWVPQATRDDVRAAVLDAIACSCATPPLAHLNRHHPWS